MNYNDSHKIYQAQVNNVRALLASSKHLRKSINYALRKNDSATAETLTKLYALLFTSFAEANFSKIIHTPYGFNPREIKQIKKACKRSVSSGWMKCLELSAKHLKAKKSNFQPNAKLKLKTLIRSNILDPSILRNKLAHGQWKIALNRENESIQQPLTHKIASLDIVTIDGWMNIHRRLADVMECLIESPNKAFMGDWYEFVSDVENEIVAINSRTLEEHIKRLRSKEQKFSKTVLYE